MTITTTSPDGMIKARVNARRPQQLAFRPGSFDSYRQSDLEYQLGRLAGLAFAGYRSGVRQIMDEFRLDVPTDPHRARTPAQHNYLEELARLTLIGPRGMAVVFAIDGIAHWHCRLARGALEGLGESEFVAVCLAAADEFVTRLELVKAELRGKHFGARRPRTTSKPQR